MSYLCYLYRWMQIFYACWKANELKNTSGVYIFPIAAINLKEKMKKEGVASTKNPLFILANLSIFY